MSSLTPIAPTIVTTDLLITVGSHYVKVTDFTPRVKYALLDFCKTLAQYGFEKGPDGRFRKAMLRVFVGVANDRSFFHFHRNELDTLVRHLKMCGIREDVIAYSFLPENFGHPVEFEVIDKRTPRDDQVEKIAYLIAEGKTKILTVDPGRGKTFMALSGIAALKRKVFVCIKAMYIEKWIGDIEAAFKCKKGDILVVRGGAQLALVTQLALAGQLTAKIVICSNMTYFGYLRDYEKFKDGLLELGYGCTPPNFFQTCGFGIRLIDEVHQDIHLNYRQDLYTHCHKTISLSGTLEGDDEFINNRTEIMFPKDERIDNGESVIFTAVEALQYRLADPRSLKWINKARKSYSHVIFEQSLMKNKRALKNYLEMISDFVTHEFRKVREGDQKLLIYCATVEMCTVVTNYLKPRNSDLKVMRYTAEDDFDEMLESDLIVSTLKSLGTAQDVPKLLHVLMTDALGSKQGNRQAMGRMRDTIFKIWPNAKPTFYYFVCVDIDKHLEYHYRKVENFKGRVVGHKLVNTDYVI